MIKILIVEDSRVVREKLKDELLKIDNFDITMVTSGEKAIEVAKIQQVDLIIMDIILEGRMDGIEASKIIYEDKEIPFIYLTNDLTPYDALPSASVYLNKPFTRNELKHNIEIALEQNRLKCALNDKIRWFKTLFDFSTEAIIMFDNNFIVNGINRKYVSIFEACETSSCGLSIQEIIKGHLDIKFLQKRFLEKQSLEVERKLDFKSKRSKYFLIKGIPIFDGGDFNGGYLTYIDITDLKRKEEEIRFISQHDVMTRLYNRRYFQEQLTKCFNVEKNNLSIIIADLNDLKGINDTYGHTQGDCYIQLAAQVIQEAMPEEVIIARIGGDEFGIILKNKDKYLCEMIGENINRLSKIYTKKKGLATNLSMAYGYAVSDESIKDVESLYHMADGDMYRRKKEMKNH